MIGTAEIEEFVCAETWCNREILEDFCMPLEAARLRQIDFDSTYDGVTSHRGWEA